MEARPPLWRDVAENPQPLVFAVCMLALAAFIGSELWSSTHAFIYRPVAVQNQNHPSDDAQQQYSDQIATAELFGRAASSSNLPETNLQLTLRAVFAASDAKQASAVIETSDGHAQVIKVGASIGGDATLQEVHGNRVVLARNGVLETLMFPAPQESTEFAVAQSAPIAGDESQSDLVPNNAPPAGTSPEEIKRAAILQRLEELRARSSR